MDAPSKHHVVPVVITICSLVSIAVMIVYTVISYKKPPVAQDSSSISASQNGKIYSFPRLDVESWNIDHVAQTKTSLSSLKTYSFTTHFGRAEFNNLITRFFKPEASSESQLSIKGYSDKSETSLFYLDKKTGSFLYKSSAGIPLASTSGALDEGKKVAAFSQILLNDDTLSSFASYEKVSKPGVTYYEIHRNWKALEFPTLNLFGLLNQGAGTQLRDLSQTVPANQIDPDRDIIRTSDDTDGKKRQNEFNTITVGVKEGTIMNVTSDIRQFALPLKPAFEKTIAYDDAVKRLTSNQFSRLYTSPEGQGAVDRDKMYPQNKATLKNATVSESIIAYLEELPSEAQDSLVPYYVFHGTGTLSTGYRVHFVATVPAAEKQVLGTFDNSQKQGTFGMDAEPAPKSTPGTTQGASQQHSTNLPQTQKPSLPSASAICDELPQSVNQLYNVQIDDTTGVTFGQYDIPAPGRVPSTLGWYGPQWYAVTTAAHDINLLDKVIDLAQTKLNLKKDTVGSTSNSQTMRDYDSLFEDWESASVACPVRLTGRSPSVFVYSDTPITVTIKPHSHITYSDPALNGGSWNITTPTSYLYYEYAPITFSRPTEGWNVNKSMIAGFAGSVAAQLGLNSTETDRLLHEISNAATDVNAQNIFVGLISEAEVNQKLPLALSPTPKSIRRIHFYLAPAVHGVVPAPTLIPITRTSYSVLEIGATLME